MDYMREWMIMWGNEGMDDYWFYEVGNGWLYEAMDEYYDWILKRRSCFCLWNLSL